MLVRIIAGLPVVILVCLCSCGGSQSQDSTSNHAQGDDAIASPGFEFPPPSWFVIPNIERSVAYKEGDLVKLGREFDGGYPADFISLVGDSAMFGASWSPGNGLNGLAYATYAFTAEGYDRAPEVRTTWSIDPAQDMLFYGLANWGEDRWDWYPGGTDPLVLASFNPYFTQDKGDMLVIVASIDDGTPQLDKIRLGPQPADTEWLHSWGGAADDYFVSVATDHMDAVYFAGYSDSWGKGLQDALLIKCDMSGNVVWARQWGGEENDYYSEVVVADDGLVYTLGTTFSFGQGSSDLFIQGWSENGMLTWTRTWGGEETTSDDQAIAMQISGSNLYALGNTRVSVANKDLVLLRFDTGGNIIWRKVFQGEGIEMSGALTAFESSPGNDEIHLALNLDSAMGLKTIAYYVVDSSGAMLMAKQWASSADEVFASDIAILGGSGGTPYICGQLATGESGDEIMLLEYSAEPFPLAMSWGINPEDEARMSAIAEDDDGNLAVCGHMPGVSDYIGAFLATVDVTGMWLNFKVLVDTTSIVGFQDMEYSSGKGVFLAGYCGSSDPCAWLEPSLAAHAVDGGWSIGTLIIGDIAGAITPVTQGAVTEINLSEPVLDIGGGSRDTLCMRGF